MKALLHVLRQGLFTQHRLAGGNAGKRQRCMELVGCGNDNSIDRCIIDHCNRITANVQGACCISGSPCAFLVGITDHLQAGAGHFLGENAGVVSPHDASANQSKTDGHDVLEC